MDLQMPEMGGLEATQQIRANPRYAGLPVIAMTAHALREERERCLQVGMVDHITKPLDPPALLHSVQRWARPASGSLAAPPAAPPVAAPEPAPAWPPQPGLDTAAGLRRVAGNEKLYLRLLQQFVQHHAHAPQRAQEALDAGDRDTLHRLVHTAKGVAGNIGLGDLAAAALALEDALHRPGDVPGVPAAMARLAAENTRALAALRSLLGTPEADAPDPGSAEPAPPGTEARALAQRMLALLADSDGDAVELLQAHAATLRSLFGPGRYPAFQNAVSGFDFELAAELLQAALHTWDTP
jgi:CheY-like chemotaxis protein